MTRNIILAAFFISIFLFPRLLMAAPPPSFSDAVGKANSFVQSVDRMLTNMFNNDNLIGIVNMQWTAFAVMLLAGVGIRYALSDLSIQALVQPLMMVAISRILIDNYSYLTGICWDLSEGIAGSIQYAGLGTRDLFFMPGFINDVLATIYNNEVSLWGAFWPLFSTFLINTFTWGLQVLAFVVNTWALWGYCLSKIIGIFFVPFLMIKRTEFLFDGWLRLFTGFLVYGILARTNLLLMIIALKSFFVIPGNQVDTTRSIRWDIECLGHTVGLIGFLLVGVLALISTGRFAATVVSGASGAGSALSKFVSSVTRYL